MSERQIYQNTDGSLQLSVPLQQESLWLSQSQMAQLFDTSADNISLHLKNVFSSGELDETATTEDFSVVRQEGKRQVKRRLKHYNLDAIISVGYRVNSVNATKFRQWATQTLKQHLLQGFTLNQHRLQHNAQELDKALQLVKRAAALPVNSEFGAGLVDIIASYTQTFLWLQQYDEGLLETPKGQLGGALTPIGDAKAAIATLKYFIGSRVRPKRERYCYTLNTKSIVEARSIGFTPLYREKYVELCVFKRMA
ncbi:RhuM family protein [Neptunomonas phycophila]|uniref:virulence RhuM family protein n=1 Tax=Neptunomonas phycophila TaxID=1572645 RepID=UPI0026E12BE1|nr:RhuM family protein [Neptunomonas phycophila]MDO6783402.1 RhuM family protein [Neptunomonas phycophila]